MFDYIAIAQLYYKIKIAWVYIFVGGFGFVFFTAISKYREFSKSVTY